MSETKTSWEVQYWYDVESGWVTTYANSESDARRVFDAWSAKHRRVRLVKVETTTTRSIRDFNNPPAREEGE